MASPIIKIKRSSVQGKSPGVADLPLGELAINTYDGRLFVSKSTDSGVSTSIVNVSGIQIQDEGNLVGYANTINFVGSGVTVLSFSDGVGIVSFTSSSGSGGATVAISTTPPTSPNPGDLWYSSLLGRTFVYYDDGSSSQWVDTAPFNTLTDPELTPGKTSNSFTATNGQTSFGVSYEVGYVEVYLNGIRLSSSEYTATDGSTIVLSEGATAGDILDVVEFIVGIGTAGPTGATGPSGPLESVTTTTGSSVHYPVIVTGVGSTTPYITTTSNYFSFTPSSGTLRTNQLVVTGVTTASSFVKSGGTSSQFLKADGSVDSSTYLTSALQNIVEDTTPQLGGNLDINGKYITGTGGISITGVTTATDFNSTSDINLKKDVKVIDDPISKVLQINGVSFNWTDTGQSSAGVIAQDVERVLPEIIRDNPTGYKSLNYNGLIGLLIEGMKEQQKQINILKQEIENLKK